MKDQPQATRRLIPLWEILKLILYVILLYFKKAEY